MYLQIVQFFLNLEDFLYSVDEVGDWSVWVGGWGQEFDFDIGYCFYSILSSLYNIDQVIEVFQCFGSVFKSIMCG